MARKRRKSKLKKVPKKAAAWRAIAKGEPLPKSRKSSGCSLLSSSYEVEIEE